MPDQVANSPSNVSVRGYCQHMKLVDWLGRRRGRRDSFVALPGSLKNCNPGGVPANGQGRPGSSPEGYLGIFFNEKTINDIETARHHLAANGRPETPGRVVAELPLGFWRFLLSGRYERSLWLPCLRGAFPGIEGRGMRRDVHDAMQELHLLRNRIAHHEPIYNRPLGRLHDLALTTAGWICPVTRQWMAGRSGVPELLRAPLEATLGR